MSSQEECSINQISKMQPSIDMYGVTTDSKDYGIGSAPANDMASYSDQCSIAGGKAFVRNKVKYEECILKVKEIMARRFERVAEKATYTEVVEEGKEAQDILRLLSSLQQTNSQNEITIHKLQRQLVTS